MSAFFPSNHLFAQSNAVSSPVICFNKVLHHAILHYRMRTSTEWQNYIESLNLQVVQMLQEISFINTTVSRIRAALRPYPFCAAGLISGGQPWVFHLRRKVQAKSRKPHNTSFCLLSTCTLRKEVRPPYLFPQRRKTCFETFEVCFIRVDEITKNATSRGSAHVIIAVCLDVSADVFT